MFKPPREIIDALLDMGLTISEIARKTDIPQPTVHAMYHDAQRRPSYERVCRIIDLLDSLTVENNRRLKRATLRQKTGAS